jgi:hypothetical protein
VVRFVTTFASLRTLALLKRASVFCFHRVPADVASPLPYKSQAVQPIISRNCLCVGTRVVAVVRGAALSDRSADYRQSLQSKSD